MYLYNRRPLAIFTIIFDLYKLFKINWTSSVVMCRKVLLFYKVDGWYPHTQVRPLLFIRHLTYCSIGKSMSKYVFE